MNIIHNFLTVFLPYVISIIEIMGIFIVTWSAVKGLWSYIQNAFFKKHVDIQSNLAVGLATGLEFKMAAEILKTVLVREMSELVILGAIIVLRALVTILLKFEIRSSKKEASKDEKITDIIQNKP